jgi:HSP20 family molecular chaperone IbpA
MATKQAKDIQAKEKPGVATSVEQTRTGLVFLPAADIFETEGELTVLADMPGVRADDLKIALDDNVLTMVGEPEPLEGSDEEDVLREYATGRYYRQFTLSDVIDQSKIEAIMTEGVLRLRLPKAEAVKPRQIPVKVA